MRPEQRQQLAAILRTFDEAGLIALSNRGLVRRAHKDLEAVGELTVEETSDALRISGPDWAVLMPPAGPAAATDDTPATGMTRQILTATLWLQLHWLEANAELEATQDESAKADSAAAGNAADSGEGSLVDAISQLNWNQLARWAGTAVLQEAVTLLPDPAQVTIEQGAVCRVQFPQHDVEVRFLPPAVSAAGRVPGTMLLESALSTAPQAFHRRWVTLAVLAIRTALGTPLQPPAEATTAKAAGLPRSRKELLTSVERLLVSMIAVGLSHPSDMLLQRLFTLSVSCVGAHLPRLARELRIIASEVQWQLDRHVRSHSPRLLNRVAGTAALTSALQRSGETIPLTLAGRHRSQYEPIGRLRGVGCGAYPWQAASGLEGVQLVLWDRERQRFWTWSTSRPVTAGGGHAQSLYASETVWNGGVSPCTLSRSVFEAIQVQANDQGRLSTSQKTELVQSQLIKTSSEQAVDWKYQQSEFGDRGFASWDVLRDHVRRTTSVGLQEADLTARIVAIFPQQWGPRLYLELEQRLSWSLLDAQGQSVDLSIPWTTLTAKSIECVEALHSERDRLQGVIGRVDQRGGDLMLFPMAFLSAGTSGQDRLINPAFDWDRLHPQEARPRLPRSHRQPAASIPTMLVADDEFEERVDGNPLPRNLAQRLTDVDRFLLMLAESGNLQHHADLKARAQSLAGRVSEAGLTELAGLLDELANAVSGEPSGEAVASILLRAVYVSRLYREVA
ncbi:MAG: hypothetical protein KDA90_14635 [Planctomycetaceae bacterium]|nr:hypothetical protein [Planctomycetaceae bacterium]